MKGTVERFQEIKGRSVVRYSKESLGEKKFSNRHLLN